MLDGAAKISAHARRGPAAGDARHRHDRPRQHVRRQRVLHAGHQGAASSRSSASRPTSRPGRGSTPAASCGAIPARRPTTSPAAASYTHLTMVAENATGLRNLFKLSSLASFEGQLRQVVADGRRDHRRARRGHHRHHRLPVRRGADPAAAGPGREALESAAKWREIFGPDNYFLELMDHGLSIERRVRDGLLEIGRKLGIRAAGHQRLPLRHPRRRAQPRGAAVRADRQDAVGPQPVQVRRRRLLPEVRRRDARAVGRRGPRACDSTLLIAERVQSYDEVWHPRDRMPVFPVPEGHDAGDLAASRGRRRLAPAVPGRCA